MNTPPNGKFEEKKNSDLQVSYLNNINNTVLQKSFKRVFDNKSENKIEKKNNDNVMFQPINYVNNNSNDQNIVKKVTFCSELKYCEGRRNYLNFIWHFNITRNIYKISTIEIKNIKGKDKEIYYLAIIYVFYEQLNCSSIIFAFQNGNNLSEKDFNNELIKIKDRIIYEGINENNNFYQNSLILNKNINGKEDINNENINYQKQNKKSFLSEIYCTNQKLFEIDIDEKKNLNISTEEEKVENEKETSFNILCNIYCPSFSSKVYKFQDVKRKKIILTKLDIPPQLYQENNYIPIIIEQRMIKNETFTNKYNGIINEGMTCYLNSMMQSYNALTLFKKAIFSLPFEKDENSLSSSLQILFYDLTFGKELVSSNKLIKSFGWEKDDIFIQHDIQEFNMMLSEIMEKKFKGTKANEIFNYLFEGTIENIIKCIEYNFQNKKIEKFNDIQLNVKGCKNIYESLNEFTKEEILDNEDKYEVEGHGKEKAIKKMNFIHLPPVLIFQLKRFEYNNETKYIEKLNDYYEFYDQLNMNKYIKNKNNNYDYTYSLISVVVHKGNVLGGHYYAFINQDPEHKNENWFCFNDENVKNAELFEVFDLNFGGDYFIPKYNVKSNCIENKNYQSDLSAYMLLYIQNSKLKEILIPINKEELPKTLENCILNEKKEEKIKYEYYNGSYFHSREDEEEDKNRQIQFIESPKYYSNDNYNINLIKDENINENESQNEENKYDIYYDNDFNEIKDNNNNRLDKAINDTFFRGKV